MRKRLISSLLSAACIFTGTASAGGVSECVIDATSIPGKVLISGTLDSAIESNLISVQIMPENVIFENIFNNPVDDNWMFCDQIKSGTNGEFSTEISSSAATGSYIAYLSARGELIKEKFTFVNKDDNKEKLKVLIGKKGDKTEFAKVAEANMTALMFENEFSGNIARGDVYEWLRAYINNPENAITENDGAKVAEQFELFCFIQALNEGDVTSFATDMKDSYITDPDILEWYNKYKSNTEAETYIRGRMSGKKFTSSEQFEKALLEAVVLYTVYKPNGTGNIKSVLTKFESYTGISASGISDYTYSTLAGNKYPDYATLKKAIYPDNGGSGSTGGSVSRPGGSSSGNSSAGGFVSIPKPEQEPKPLKTFEDLEGYDWAYEAIVALATEGVISGVSETEYKPGANVTREQFVKMIVGIKGLELLGYEEIFDDVKKDDWFAPSVVTAYKNGLCNGVGNRLFGTGYNIKRQDMAVMIKNVLANTKVDIIKDAIVFEDGDEISDYAKEAVDLMTQLGIMNGKGGNIFDPKAPATRAEAAVVIYATMKLLK